MRRLLMVLATVRFVFLIGGSSAMAEDPPKALILESSVIGGAVSPDASDAAANGFTVTVVDDAAWGDAWSAGGGG